MTLVALLEERYSNVWPALRNVPTGQFLLDVILPETVEIAAGIRDGIAQIRSGRSCGVLYPDELIAKTIRNTYALLEQAERELTGRV